MTTIHSGKRSRDHYWDVIRGTLMLLGVPYHASLVYRAHRTWWVQSPEASAFASLFGEMLKSFRMPAFFVLAGYFSILLLRRRPRGEWLRSRIVRLAVPFVSAMLLLNPIQIVASAFAQQWPDAWNWSAALPSILTNLRAPGSHWIRHLWFLQVLLMYCFLLAGLYPFLQNPKIPGLLSRLRPVTYAPLCVVFCCIWILMTDAGAFVFKKTGIGDPFAGMLDLKSFFFYLPFFFIGVLIQYSPSLQHRFRSAHRTDVLLGLSACIAFGFIARIDGNAMAILADVVLAFASIYMTITIISLSFRHFNHPSPLVTRFVDASFTIYLVHVPIITMLGLLLHRVTFPPVIEYVLLVIGTFLLSYGAHMAVRRSAILLFLFNGVPIKRREKAIPGTG